MFLNVCYQNVRGLNTKLTRLFSDSLGFNYDVIVFSETWLKPSVLNSEILCSRYQIFRKDRVLKKGGGVLIAVDAKYSTNLIELNCFDIEFICISIELENFKLFVTCSYIPPSSQLDIYNQHLLAINSITNKMNDSDKILVLGDFNLPSVKWLSLPDSEALTPLTSDANVNLYTFEIVNRFSDINLYQINSVSNCYDRILDLAFVNYTQYFEIIRIPPVCTPEDNYHPTLCISMMHNNLATNNSLISFKSVPNYNKTDFRKLNALISNVNWSTLFICKSHSDLELSVYKFYDILNKFILECVPIVRVRNSERYPWVTSGLSSIKNYKNKLFKKYKKSGSSIDYAKYAVARSKYTSESRKLYNLYLNKIKLNFKSNPKSFYDFVNIKRKATSKPTILKFNNQTFEKNSEISECFANFFATTYSYSPCPNKDTYSYKLSTIDQISMPFLQSQYVSKNLRNLRSIKSPGPDGIPSIILKYCSDTLAIPLTLLFNYSLKYSHFPTFWKKSYIVPLHKSGSLTNVSNYRGIAKLSAIPKLFEKLITDVISHKVQPILSPYQHGFRSGLSTITNLIQFSSTVIKGFIQRNQTDTIYTDFSKAFDRVNHELLIYKLNQIGFSINLVKWISSYLRNRSQVVLFDDCLSKSINVPSGVPQGSHLGPLLFLLFINDLPNAIIHSKLLMYADDVKLFITHNSMKQADLLQNDLNNLFQWCELNCMDLNLNKCKHMCFSRSSTLTRQYNINGTVLSTVDSFVDLGILMDPKLNFNNHVISMVNKAHGVLGFIKRWAKEFSDPYITKQLFTSLVRPILEYGSVVWDPQYTIYSDKIESVQKQFLIFALRGLHWNSDFVLPSYTSRLKLIRLPTLKSRRIMLNTMIVIKILSGNIPSDFLISSIRINVPFRSSRYYQPLYVDFHRTNYSMGDPLSKMCIDFNSVYSKVDFCMNIDLIKSNIIIFLNE